MTANKIDQNIKEKLFSANTATVISEISKVKEKGNKLYLPILFDILNTHPEKEIETEITKLLATVKDKESVSIFTEAIENKKYRPILKTLLTTSWQNGLDFSASLPLFIEIIINEDWEIAFEAFTIVDNLETLPEKEIIEESLLKIKTGLKTSNEQKTYFLQEILTKIT